MLLLWIAQLILNIPESYLEQYLKMSGFSDAETAVAKEKLVSRRKNLAEVLGLLGQYPRLQEKVIDKNLKVDDPKHAED